MYFICESELVLTLLIEVVEGHTHKIIVPSDIGLACRGYHQIACCNATIIPSCSYAFA